MRAPAHVNRRSCALILIGSLLTSCAVGPDYTPPETSVPTSFSNARGTAESNDVATWWRGLQDPLLDRLVQEAVTTNLDVSLATARVRQARALLTASTASFFPQPNVSASYTRSRSSPNAFVQQVPNSGSGGTTVPNVGQARPGQEINFYQTGFDAIWELDLFGGIRRQVEAARDQYEAQNEARRDTLVTLVAEVASAYTQLRASQRGLEITRQNAASQRETLELERDRLTAGLTSELTVAQAEAQVVNTEARIPQIEVPLKQSIYRLGVLLGREPTALEQDLSPPLPIPVPPPSVSVGVPSELLRRRPDVRQAERTLAAATANVGVATADLFPRLQLNGTLGLRSRQSGNFLETGSAYWSVGPSINWAILNWYAVLANIEIQNAVQEQALIAYKQTVLNAIEEVEGALVAFQQEQIRRDALHKSVEANRHALDLARQLNTAGVADFLNVLTAQRSLFEAEAQLVESEQTVTRTFISLYKALGGGWETTEGVGDFDQSPPSLSSPVPVSTTQTAVSP